MRRLLTVLSGRRAFAWLLAVGCILAVRVGDAEQVVFQLQGPNSLLAAPFVNEVGLPMAAQDPGGTSLTTTYSGTITVDVDNLLAPTTITFLSANAVAANSGNWLPQVGGGDGGDPNVSGDANPGTPMPANYGFVLDLGGPGVALFYAASRDTIVSLNAAAKPITAGQFDPFGIGITLPQATYDANISSMAFPDLEGGATDDVSDATGTNCTDEASGGTANRCGSLMGSYAVSGNTITLTLPLDFILAEGGDPQVGFTGTFVATASLEQPLIGDYNDDGTVNAADYTVWRDNVGATDALENDDIGGVIGTAHYDQWKAAFGNSGSGSGTAAVPEPASVMLCMVGLLGLWFARRGMR
ncbi:MAG: PEP-CTERM sorting domain-containing protein [Pirellulales bacterium]